MSSCQGSSSSNEDKKHLRNERDRERRRNETPQQREARLAKRRVKDGARCEARQAQKTLVSAAPDLGSSRETEQQREERLSADRSRSRSRRQRETTPERQLRQAGDKARSQLRREIETTPERELRQAGDRARSQLRREIETTPEEQLRLASQRVRSRLRRERETTPEEQLHEGDRYQAVLSVTDQQISPYDTMLKYHETMSFIKSLKCDTCFENFPTLSVSLQPNGVSKCSTCANDKHIPKLYSSENNMNPGVVPRQLQVL